MTAPGRTPPGRSWPSSRNGRRGYLLCRRPPGPALPRAGPAGARGREGERQPFLPPLPVVRSTSDGPWRGDRVSPVEPAAQGEGGQRRNGIRPGNAHMGGPCRPWKRTSTGMLHHADPPPSAPNLTPSAPGVTPPGTCRRHGGPGGSGWRPSGSQPPPPCRLGHLLPPNRHYHAGHPASRYRPSRPSWHPGPHRRPPPARGSQPPCLPPRRIPCRGPPAGRPALLERPPPKRPAPRRSPRRSRALATTTQPPVTGRPLWPPPPRPRHDHAGHHHYRAHHYRAHHQRRRADHHHGAGDPLTISSQQTPWQRGRRGP
jgi:hypothetical protein